MRHTATLLFALWIAALPVFAQQNAPAELEEVFELERRGQFENAINLAQAAIDSQQLSGVLLGRAYLELGAAYREEGRFTPAKRSFEQSLSILEQNPNHQGDYASGLENYADLYNDAGQIDVAVPLWVKALLLRQQVGDHAGAMVSLTNLAGAAIVRQQLHEASDLVKKASDEMKLASDLSEDDHLVFLETQAWLALAEGNPRAAIDRYEQALQICTRIRGQSHWLTGWEHLLLGKAYAQAADTRRALSEMHAGLEIIQQAVGANNPKYFAAEVAYSQLLDRAGSHAEAARLRAAAEKADKDLYVGQCPGCTINVAGFR